MKKTVDNYTYTPRSCFTDLAVAMLSDGTTSNYIFFSEFFLFYFPNFLQKCIYGKKHLYRSVSIHAHQTTYFRIT